MSPLRRIWFQLRYSVTPFQELRRPRFPVDRELVSKQLRAAERCPVNGIKGRLIVEEETLPPHITERRPVDFEDLPA